MSLASVTLPPVQHSARQARMMAEIAIPLLFAAIVLPLIGSIYLALFEPRSDAALAPWLNAAIALIEAIPSLVLAWAILAVRSVLREYEQGRFLSLVASRNLKRTGEGALAALVLKAVFAPVVITLLRGEPLTLALNPDKFDIGVLLFSVFILVIGGVLEAAATALKAENDQIV